LRLQGYSLRAKHSHQTQLAFFEGWKESQEYQAEEMPTFDLLFETPTRDQLTEAGD
jgi:hypothetical protein